MKYLSIMLIFIFLTAACTPVATPATTLAPSPVPTDAPPLSTPTHKVVVETVTPATQGITDDLLRNFTYVLDSSGGVQVTLVNGTFNLNDTVHNMVASGQLVQSALGDLNGDGVPDAAVTLAANFGGSGTFHELIVVLSQDGAAVQAADLFLEDRLSEKQLTIADGLITLEAVRHGAQDPLCCPTENAVTVYRYQTGQLEVVSDQVLVPSSSTQPDQYPNQITIEAPLERDLAGTSLQLRGTTSQMPFEKNLVVRVFDSGGNLVVEQPLMVQGEYGGPGSFETTLQLPVDLKGTAHLDVVDIDMANGQPRGLASVTFTIQ